MNENIKKFMQKVAADEALQAKMKSFTDLDSAYEFASSIQDGFTKEEFSEAMSDMKKRIDTGSDELDGLCIADVENSMNIRREPSS